MSTLPTVCIIGAGCSGFTVAKRLKDFGIPFDCFEASDEVGGNWYYKNPNGMSACYQSLHIDTSTRRLEFEDYPAPQDWPHFPHHTLMHQYFKDYVDHFGLRESITFNTRVDKAIRQADGKWAVTVSTGATKVYDALVVANGHHWDPRTPEYPGEFDGDMFHAHSYRSPFEPVDMRGKNVMVVGMGNSGLDITSELSHRSIAKHVWNSARRPTWVLPKFRGGVPADMVMMPAWMPKKLGLKISRRAIKKSIGNMEDYGLLKPDHEPLSSHPGVSVDFLANAASGDITCVPGIAKLDGDAVILTDGRRLELDALIFATGYNTSFPFFEDPALQPDAENNLKLFKRVFKPGIDNLYFAGLAQSVPTIVNLAEAQSHIIARHLAGGYELPSVAEMNKIIDSDEEMHLEQYYKAPRHAMMVSLTRYNVDMERELAEGDQRAAKVAAVKVSV